MATYYVDFVGGADANNGTSTATPWQHAPGDANATANAAITLSAGDTVIFKGGAQYNGEIDVNASGTSSSRITFLSGDRATPAYGTGRGIIDGQVTRKFGFLVNGRSWIDIEGLEIRNLGAPTSDAAAIDYENSAGTADNNRVRYCLIHNVNWSAPYVAGYGIENNHGAFHTYEYNEIYNCTDKLIENFGGLTRGTKDSHHNVIRYNTLHNSAVHGVVLTSDDDAFYNNIVYQTQDGTFAGFPNPGYGLKVDEGSRNAIYNNLFYKVNAGLGVLSGDDNKFYENTIYGIGMNGGGYHGSNDEVALALFDNGVAPFSTPRLLRNEFKNNLIYYQTRTGQDAPMFVFIQDDGSNGNLFQNNTFFKTTGDTVSTTDRVRHRIGGVNAYSNVTDFEANFNSWEGGSGNVASGNIAVDPLLLGGSLDTVANLPTGFSGTSPNAEGLKIDATSPAKAGGLVLGAPYDTDITGVSRVAYSLGAYEVSVSVAIPTPPTSSHSHRVVRVGRGTRWR
jgi:hypothetical protein